MSFKGGICCRSWLVPSLQSRMEDSALISSSDLKHIAEVYCTAGDFPLVGVHTNFAVSGDLHTLACCHFILAFPWKAMGIFPLQKISKKTHQHIFGEILHAPASKWKPRIPSETLSVQLRCCFVLKGWLGVAGGISSLSSLTSTHVILMKYFGGNLAFAFQICFVAPVGGLKLPSQQLSEYQVTQHALMPCHISVFAHSLNSPKHCVPIFFFFTKLQSQWSREDIFFLHFLTNSLRISCHTNLMPFHYAFHWFNDSPFVVQVLRGGTCTRIRFALPLWRCFCVHVLLNTLCHSIWRVDVIIVNDKMHTVSLDFFFFSWKML